MTDEQKKVKVTVKDKRRTGDPTGGTAPPAPNRSESPAGSAPPSGNREDVVDSGGRLKNGLSPGGTTAPAAEAEHDYLADLQRVQAEFENYRKRVMRDQADMAGRATASLAGKLLPVLDNFERAISHGEGGEGVALVYKELKGVLEATGLEEIEADGATFDPTVHEAVMVQEDDSVDAPTVKEVQRRGYRLGERLVRPAMVVVARPAEAEPDGEEVAE